LKTTIKVWVQTIHSTINKYK